MDCFTLRLLVVYSLIGNVCFGFARFDDILNWLLRWYALVSCVVYTCFVALVYGCCLLLTVCCWVYILVGLRIDALDYCALVSFAGLRDFDYVFALYFGLRWFSFTVAPVVLWV